MRIPLSLAPRSDIYTQLHAVRGGGFNDISLYGAHQTGSGWFSNIVRTVHKHVGHAVKHAAPILKGALSDMAQTGLQTLAAGGSLKDAAAAAGQQGRQSAIQGTLAAVSGQSGGGLNMRSKRRRVNRHPF